MELKVLQNNVASVDKDNQLSSQLITTGERGRYLRLTARQCRATLHDLMVIGRRRVLGLHSWVHFLCLFVSWLEFYVHSLTTTTQIGMNVGFACGWIHDLTVFYAAWPACNGCELWPRLDNILHTAVQLRLSVCSHHCWLLGLLTIETLNTAAVLAHGVNWQLVRL